MRRMPSDAPFACDLSRLSAAQRVREKVLLAEFKTLCERREETELGFRFFVRADPEVLTAMGEFLALERLCCPFLEFHLEVSSKSLAALHIFGREGAKPIIAAEFIA
jgi:hypothetical protein